MKTVFVDSNVFLRFFKKDEPAQHEKAARLFRQAALGELSLVVGPPVLFEIAWTLRSAYQLPKAQILDVLSSIAAIPGLKLLDAELVAEAIALAQNTNSDFADAYIVAAAIASDADEIASFNRAHFERLSAKLAEL